MIQATEFFGFLIFRLICLTNPTIFMKSSQYAANIMYFQEQIKGAHIWQMCPLDTQYQLLCSKGSLFSFANSLTLLNMNLKCAPSKCKITFAFFTYTKIKVFNWNSTGDSTSTGPKIHNMTKCKTKCLFWLDRI